jgi:hypothetical protein
MVGFSHGRTGRVGSKGNRFFAAAKAGKQTEYFTGFREPLMGAASVERLCGASDWLLIPVRGYCSPVQGRIIGKFCVMWCGEMAHGTDDGGCISVGARVYRALRELAVEEFFFLNFYPTLFLLKK